MVADPFPISMANLQARMADARMGMDTIIVISQMARPDSETAAETTTLNDEINR